MGKIVVHLLTDLKTGHVFLLTEMLKLHHHILFLFNMNRRLTSMLGPNPLSCVGLGKRTHRLMGTYVVTFWVATRPVTRRHWEPVGATGIGFDPARLPIRCARSAPSPPLSSISSPSSSSSSARAVGSARRHNRCYHREPQAAGAHESEALSVREEREGERNRAQERGRTRARTVTLTRTRDQRWNFGVQVSLVTIRCSGTGELPQDTRTKVPRDSYDTLFAFSFCFEKRQKEMF